MGEAPCAINVWQAAAVRPRVALRINPDIQLRGAGQRMGGGPRPFGIDAEAAPEVLALLAKRFLCLNTLKKIALWYSNILKTSFNTSSNNGKP